MPTEEFVMRGKTASGGTEVLNFGSKHGYDFRIIEFSLFPTTNVGNDNHEMMGTVTAGKTAITPIAPDFSDEGLIDDALTRHAAVPIKPSLLKLGLIGSSATLAAVNAATPSNSVVATLVLGYTSNSINLKAYPSFIPKFNISSVADAV